MRIVLFVITLASFLTPFTLSSVNVALPSIGREFGVDAITLNWIATSFLLSSAMFLVPFGRLADIKGRKRIFATGIAFFTLGSLFSALSTSAELLIAFRIFQGIGGAMIFSTGIAILTSVFPPSERGKVLGINVASVYTGLSLGPFFGGILTQNFGWRSVFLVNVPLGLLIAFLTYLKLKGEWAEARGEKFDVIGSLIYSATLISIMLGVSEFSIPLIIAGLILLVTFVLWESKVEHPVLEISLFRKNVTFTLSNLAALLNYSATFAVAFLLSLYLQYVKELTPQQAGFVLVAQPVIQAIFSPLAGWLSDRVEPRIVASTGMAINAFGLFVFSKLSETTPLNLILFNLMLMGFGFALFSSPNTNAIMSSVDRKFYGVASAILSTMRVLGQTMSMAVVMLVFAAFLGEVEITPEVYPTFIKSVQVCFIIFAILCLFGVFASLARGKVRN
ncbi:drug resistance transporter, EmrB/QacA subfamily [Ferroglobus placidus DSM 10642]|uniref:Drug resistance transporter, EmrB/QacA subfamily n=1 Tax=Ferroglobus placidus (strain DSM 10642 / AEDII12DO) TaxID=589924 RepID=D3RZX2_FERPA|nr:MFS transporter [Ferroglobus placidus]ADC66035.1 drug resistance transporter, EmrB/QacA subfamily [Ferroglobus placidus DSM 10642]